jgi:hypothetical protein
MNIFVGNLSFEAKEIDIQRAFAAFGVVTSVVIVTEKKGKKSRGFGFVEMPDEQEALAAIAQLQGKAILGRPINVMPALSKEPKSPPVSDGSFVRRTGKYKEGRRSLSFVKKRLASGVTASIPERRYKSNPMRWRKKPRWQAPVAKPEGELKPWQRPQTESNPWKKPKSKSDSWKKPEGELKPWQRPQTESNPWKKPKSKSDSWKKPEGELKPWQRPQTESNPWKKPKPKLGSWKKPEGVLKPWRKASADRAQSGLKKRSRFSR